MQPFTSRTVRVVRDSPAGRSLDAGLVQHFDGSMWQPPTTWDGTVTILNPTPAVLRWYGVTGDDE